MSAFIHAHVFDIYGDHAYNKSLDKKYYGI